MNNTLPNKQFILTVNDIELIEASLNKQLSKLSTQRLTVIESTIKPESELESVKRIDLEVKKIRDLLGRLHNQKNWYRPNKDNNGLPYISG